MARWKISIPEVNGAKEKASLGYLIRRAAIAYRIRLERALRDLEISPPQFYVLIKLSAYQGISNADLARLTLLTPQSLSVTVAHLERAGLVSRRPHEAHGRIRRLELTKEGEGMLEKARERARELQRDLMEGLSQEEEQTIRGWLAKVATLGVSHD